MSEEKKVRIEGLVKTLDQMSDDELLERLRTVRHNREVARPVAKRKAAKAEGKASRKRLDKVGKMLDDLSEEEKRALMEQLENGDA